MQKSSPSPSPSPSPPTQHPFFTTIPIPSPKDHKTTLYIILATSLFSLLFFLSSSSTSTSTSQIRPDPYLLPTHQTSSDPSPPSIAYLISRSTSNSGRILCLLLATYHPKNQYLLHLDLTAPQFERDGPPFSFSISRYWARFRFGLKFSAGIRFVSLYGRNNPV
ncbi:hypothetical protein CMV_006600 [Castanea mollissima]|uniref:Uncharacterized protein n=1 Tax=Castanea mollissima TaxID=60419 RepID=A0A8J4RJI6_9ROSI|nr:hypothetical protein CMV_006600 [Castanea mollissima]